MPVNKSRVLKPGVSGADTTTMVHRIRLTRIEINPNLEPRLLNVTCPDECHLSLVIEHLAL